MKRVLIFVISAWEYPYPQLTQCSLETWDAFPVPGMETFFYCGQPRQPAPRQVIQFDVPEGLENMGAKNLVAFQWALDYGPWDYMARVNSSCYVRKRKLLNYCQELPGKNLFQGVGVRASNGHIDYLWGGSQYILSRDVVETVVANQNKLKPKLMDDVSLSCLVRDCGLPFDLNGQACSLNKSDKGWRVIGYGNARKAEACFTSIESIPDECLAHFIRVKQDQHRDLDIRIMHILHERKIT